MKDGNRSTERGLWQIHSSAPSLISLQLNGNDIGDNLAMLICKRFSRLENLQFAQLKKHRGITYESLRAISHLQFLGDLDICGRQTNWKEAIELAARLGNRIKGLSISLVGLSGMRFFSLNPDLPLFRLREKYS